jgi:uncharacterized membrane protein YkoI
METVPVGARGVALNTADGGWMAGAMLSIVLATAPATSAHEVSQEVSHEVSREQAAQMLQNRYGNAARVVRTDVIEQGGRRVYVFRLLSANGRVWIVRIDARTGAEVP